MGQSRKCARIGQSIEQLESRRLLAATDFDTTFGVGGKALLDHVTETADTVNGFSFVADNHLLIGGYSDGGDTRSTLARLNLDGTLNTSFGQNGKTRLTTGTGF